MPNLTRWRNLLDEAEDLTKHIRWQGALDADNLACVESYKPITHSERWLAEASPCITRRVPGEFYATREVAQVEARRDCNATDQLT